MIGSIISHVTVFIVGAVIGYLFLRNNKDIKDKVDDAADIVDTVID